MVAFANVLCDAVYACAVVLTLVVATFVYICSTSVAGKAEVAFACSVSVAGAMFAGDPLTDGEFAACLADKSVLANALERIESFDAFSIVFTRIDSATKLLDIVAAGRVAPVHGHEAKSRRNVQKTFK